MRTPVLVRGPHAAPYTAAIAARSARPQSNGVQPAFSVGCMLKCVGGALDCLSCGTNIGCWLSCAGPKALKCLGDCF